MTEIYRDPQLEDYKKFFDETPVALVRTDIESGKFLMANEYAAHMFGYKSAEDLIANGCTIELYPPEARKHLVKTLRKQHVVENYEVRLALPHQIIWVSARFHINCGGSCIEGSLIDITETVNLRERELSKLKEMGSKLESALAN